MLFFEITLIHCVDHQHGCHVWLQTNWNKINAPAMKPVLERPFCGTLVCYFPLLHISPSQDWQEHHCDSRFHQFLWVQLNGSSPGPPSLSRSFDTQVLKGSGI